MTVSGQVRWFKKSDFKVNRAKYRQIDNEELAKAWYSFIGHSNIALRGGKSYFSDNGDKIYEIVFKSIPSLDFLSLLKYASVMVGNSSCGVIEAPSFRLPVVNIGMRQKGRERANNIIDVNYNKEEIKKAIEEAMSPEFIDFLKDCKNPYGDGKTGPRIAKILSEIRIDRCLLQKKMAY